MSSTWTWICRQEGEEIQYLWSDPISSFSQRYSDTPNPWGGIGAAPESWYDSNDEAPGRLLGLHDPIMRMAESFPFPDLPVTRPTSRVPPLSHQLPAAFSILHSTSTLPSTLNHLLLLSPLPMQRASPLIKSAQLTSATSNKTYKGKKKQLQTQL